MIAEDKRHFSAPQGVFARLWPWLNTGLTIALVALGVWYVARRVSLAEIGSAFALARVDFIALGVVTILLTSFVKTWRWELLLRPHERTSFSALFWALMLGQYVNLLVPVLRLGEIARVYALNRQAGTAKVRALGTIVVEKALDMITLGLTMALLVSAVILPGFLTNSHLSLTVLALIALAFLYLLAYQTRLVLSLLQRLAGRLPLRLGELLLRLAVSGLEGLSALRDRRLNLALIGSSVVVALLSILTPLVLFPAFHLDLGLAEAALIHVVVTIALAPPSTPAKIGIFDGAVAFLLLRFGVSEEGVVVAYTIIYHLVAVLPLILLGGIAAARTGWRWQHAAVTPDQSA